jgi:hypothetical protein
MDSDTRVRLLSDALSAAEDVFDAYGASVSGVVLLAELDGQGVSIVTSVEEPISGLLAEASVRAAGAGA